MTQQVSYKSYFDEYLKTAFQIEVDLRFWKHFLSTSIKNYKLENPENRWINEAGFSLYNLQPDGLSTWLHVSQQTSSIEIKDLETHSDNFFTWIMNLSITRIYNVAELFLLQAIRLKYFPSLLPLNNNKKNANKISGEIKSFFSANNQSFDTTNNRYLIEFLKTKSAEFSSFLTLKVNVDWTTKWGGFYEFFSILRNVITHHAMIITPDIRNNLNSVAKDAFNHYFIQPANTVDTDMLKAKDEHDFLFFLSHVNDFVTNTVKFIAGETNLTFIGLHKA
jgi:hypothetical protein